MAHKTRIDVLVRDEGTIAQLIPLTAAARNWIEDNCNTESWQWLGDALCIEPRYAVAVTEGLRENGYTVAQA